MYLTLTETTPSQRTTTTRWTNRSATYPTTTTRRTTTRRITTTDGLIHAWARRAMAANGFGDAGC